MRKAKFLFLLLFIGALVVGCEVKNQPSASASTASATIDYDKEKEAILKVLEGESAAFWNKDFEGYASHWLQEDYIRTLGWWKLGGVTVVKGWDERSNRTKSHMEASPDPNATATQVRREDINLRIYPEVAWMTFDQYGDDTGDTLMDMAGLSRETRIFEKHDGEWKIVYVGWLLEEPSHPNE